MFGTTQSEIKVWDIHTQAYVTEFRTKSSHPLVTDVCFSQAHNIAAVSSITRGGWMAAQTGALHKAGNSNGNGSGGSSGGRRSPLSSSVQVWSVDHRGLSHELMNNSNGGNGDGGCVTKMVMNGQGTTLVTGSTDGVVRMYDIDTHQEIHAFNAHMDGGGVGGLVYRPGKGGENEVLVTCGRSDGNILDWDIRDLKTGPKVVRRYTGATMNDRNEQHHNYHLDMRYDASSNYLMTGSKGGRGVLYKTFKKSPIDYFGHHHNSVVAVDWMPVWTIGHDSAMSFALTGSLDGSMCIWSLMKKKTTGDGGV